jgi:hypothetical protein
MGTRNLREPCESRTRTKAINHSQFFGSLGDASERTSQTVAAAEAATELIRKYSQYLSFKSFF